MKISPARAAAFDVLFRIETEKAYSSTLLPFYEGSLSTLDSALCHELVLGTLRRQIYLDRLVEYFTNVRKLDTAVLIAIRLGLYQLLFLDKIPAYSAINESVQLVQRAKKTSAKGFVNGVLRRATREKIELQFADGIERLSVETSHPRWLIEKWSAEFGKEEAALIAKANNEVPRASFRMLKPIQDIDPQVQTGWQTSEVVEGAFFTKHRGQEMRRLEREEAIYFQDEASQMVAQAVDITVGGSFLDVCAAPGGKTGMIARRSAGKTGLIAAGDLPRHRVEHLRANCIRHGVTCVEVIQYDAERPLPFADRSFDTVLVDVPCSGTGTIRHNPEIRYSRTIEDLLELPEKQLKILVNASKTVKDRGTLVYSTCSLEREENELVAQLFLANNSLFSQGNPGVPHKFITSEGFARTWPHRDDMDGFFIATFVRDG